MDIVEELRSQANPSLVCPDGPDSMTQRAADEIERLRALSEGRYHIVSLACLRDLPRHMRAAMVCDDGGMSLRLSSGDQHVQLRLESGNEPVVFRQLVAMLEDRLNVYRPTR